MAALKGGRLGQPFHSQAMAANSRVMHPFKEKEMSQDHYGPQNAFHRNAFQQMSNQRAMCPNNAFQQMTNQRAVCPNINAFHSNAFHQMDHQRATCVQEKFFNKWKLVIKWLWQPNQIKKAP